MSQAVRGALVILVVLLIVSVGVAVFTLTQKQALEKQNQNLQSEVTDYQNKETELLAKAKQLEKASQELTDRVSQQEKEKQQIRREYDEIKSKFEILTGQFTQVSGERDDWKTRLETIRRERDDLMEKLRTRPEKIVYKEKEFEANSQEAAVPAVTSPEGDQYWAKVLKDKAALQLDMDKAKSDMDQSALTIVDLKSQVADMQLELKNITDAKQELEHKMQENQQEFERKLQYQEDLANNLSLEMARSRNAQKFVNERADKIKEENLALQAQIKQQSTTKLALEKTVAHLNQDKVGIEKKLAETEGVIQGRIDEVWQIKQNLDKKISDLSAKSNGEVVLPPIIVNAQGGQGAPPAAPPVKSQGMVISINETNNFVIVDLGEKDGSKVGRVFKVYRGNNVVANLEVIQVRKDISAADIKN